MDEHWLDSTALRRRTHPLFPYYYPIEWFHCSPVREHDPNHWSLLKRRKAISVWPSPAPLMRRDLLLDALKERISFIRLMASENGTTVCSAEIWCWSHNWQKILSHVSQKSNSSLLCESHLGITSRRWLTIKSSNWLTRNDGGNEVTPPRNQTYSHLCLGKNSSSYLSATGCVRDR